MNEPLPKNVKPLAPGDMMREYLDDLNLTQQQLADALGISRQRTNEILTGKRIVTADTAMRLERVFGLSALFWLRLQADVDLYRAEHAPAAREIAKLRPIKKTAA